MQSCRIIVEREARRLVVYAVQRRRMARAERRVVVAPLEEERQYPKQPRDMLSRRCAT
jgi:hypothetical protein